MQEIQGGSANKQQQRGQQEQKQHGGYVMDEIQTPRIVQNLKWQRGA